MRNSANTSPHPPGIPRFWPAHRVFYGWAIVGAAFVATFAEVPALGPVLTVFVKPIQDELGWSYRVIALGFLMGSASGAIASSVTGWLVDKYGPRVVVALGGLALAGALFGLSTIQEPWHFWTYFGLARGSVTAGVEIGASVAIAKWFIRQRGRTLAVKAMGHRAGQVVLPIVSFLIMDASDWRTAYVALSGFACLAIIGPALLLMRSQPEDHGLLPDGATDLRKASGGGEVPASAGTTGIVEEVSWTLREARGTRAFWLITVFLVCTPFVQGATNLHMAPIFHDRGLSEGQAVAVVAIFGMSSASSILPTGFIMERVHVRLGAMAQAVLVLATMMLLLVPAGGFPLAVLWAILFGVAAGMRNIIEILLLANYFGRTSLGAIKGFTAPFRMISPFGPLLAAHIRDETGSYTGAFLLFASVAVLMLLLMVFAAQPTKAPTEQQPAGA
ncbi:MAG: MFS transporter [Chloroflexi bacterium]|nr:MFS transporter [Chloroflexota bacterium]MYK36019.1 MFS transporter [Chloroflexota bacterium]